MKWQAFVLVLAMSVIATLPACREKAAIATTNPLLKAYDSEQDANDPQHVILLNYQQAQGKRVFYCTCVWCHAEATPAGPSNRSNVTPTPPLFNDGETLNPLSDEFLQNTITLGGSAMGKSTMMPPWGQTLSENEIRSVIAYIRVVAQPPYQLAARPASQYPVK
jgi:cytochrome c oxidase cbb3-type subunit 3